VGIAQTTGEVTREAGIISLVPLAAMFSISLAIFNILPIPALDGGRLLFVLLEWVRRGKRIPPEKEGLVHFAGFVALIVLVLGPLTYNDIARIVNGGSLLR
jgi:regulator of sigma E protease